MPLKRGTSSKTFNSNVNMLIRFEHAAARTRHRREKVAGSLSATSGKAGVPIGARRRAGGMAQTPTGQLFGS